MELRGGRVQWHCSIFNEAAIAILAQFASDLAKGVEKSKITNINSITISPCFSGSMVEHLSLEQKGAGSSPSGGGLCVQL
jgi:hypothetical protein